MPEHGVFIFQNWIYMAVYILYPTTKFIAKRNHVNFFVRSLVCCSFGAIFLSTRIFFDNADIYEKQIWVDALVLVKKSSKSELSWRFLSRLKFACHFLANLADRPGIYIESPYETNFSRDVCLNSLKSGGQHFKEPLVADMVI